MSYNSPIPQLGLGTFGRTGDEGMQAILTAIEIGYRHIDTAQSYDTESNVGEAIRRSGLPRSDFFVTTKVADTNLAKPDFLPSVEKSLETIGTDRVDLLLIHWPSENDQVPFEDYVMALAEAKQRGWAKHIGVSNFPIALLAKSFALLGRESIATDQVEIHPYLQAPRLASYCREKGLILTAYQPLYKGAVNDDTLLKIIAAEHGVTAAAVALAFLMAEGHAVIPASGSERNLKANFAARDVALTADEIARIRTLDRSIRHINPTKSPRWDD
ncbi:aldo/keto reductase [Sinorhizobium meliloti]|uniref:aldo/keto reductase n=1 Tax=Rhizobium meliloti TaxID=382 RepID=UPI0012960BB8|nr:aldo/keto reductase [Sinorhizobium meliloti]MQW59680.1 aldo/keto reductase [Sinorhizobium meliloti]